MNKFFNNDDKLSELRKEKQEEEKDDMETLKRMSALIRIKNQELDVLIQQFQHLKSELIIKKNSEINNLKGFYV